MRDRALAAMALGGGLRVLLPRMRADFESTGTLRSTTASAMWAMYALGSGLYGDALRRGKPAPPLARAGAGTAVAGGLALTAAGMGAFSSARQLAGTDIGDLRTGGVYRISRNPQYAGFVISGLGAAAARRSAFAAALAVGYAAICHWWVRVEERSLEREFGDRYLAFHAAAPRWIGWRRSRG